jgi:elongation factor G
MIAVDVRVPEEHMGDFKSDLNARRGRVLGMDTAGDGTPVVSPQVPSRTCSRTCRSCAL